MKYLKALCLLAPCALIVGNASPARADLYGDAKDIIQQLVEDEIATQAVPNAASKIPAVCEFFPETVAAIQDKRYSGLPIVLRGEVSDAVGLLVVQRIAKDLGQLAKKSMAASTTQKDAPASAVSAAAKADAASAAADVAQMKTVAAKAGVVKAEAARGDIAKAKGDIAKAKNDVDKATEEQAQAAQESDSANANKNTMSVTAAESIDAARPIANWSGFSARLSADGGQAAIDSLARAAKPKEASAPNEAVSSTPKETKDTPAFCVFPSLQSRSEGKPITAYESIASVAMRACMAPQADLDAEAACAAGLLTRDAANGNNGALAPDGRRLAAALAVLAAKGGFSSGWKLTDKQLVTLAWDMAGWLAKPSDGNTFAQTVCSSFPNAPATCQAEVAAAAQPLLSSALPVNIITLDDALGLVAVVSAQCTSTVCNEISIIATGGEHIVSDIRAKNYGAAAGQIFESVEDFTNCQKEGEKRDFCAEKNKKVYRFLQKLAVYSIDSATSNDGTSSAEGDFRKAAVDMIEAFAGQGVHRNLFVNAGFLYIPELGLRYAWRPGHVNRDSGSPMLAYPSVDLLRWRISNNLINNGSSSVFVALSGSVLDPLGPLTEVATRDQRLDSDPARKHVFWWGFVTPRADIELGIPELTKNLVVGGGAAFRFFRAQYNPGSTTPTYCEFNSKCGLESTQKLNWDNAELNVFVKYVP